MSDVDPVEYLARVICQFDGCDEADCHERNDAARGVIRAIRTDPALRKALGVVMLLSADPDRTREHLERLTELLRREQRRSTDLRTLVQAALDQTEDSPEGLRASHGQEVKRTHDHWKP